MYFRIEHQLRFQYSQPVFIEPTIVRLRPRSDSWQELRSFQINVHPAPQGSAESDGLDGTPGTLLWFSGLTETLSITTLSEVRTLRENPFDFILPKKQPLPFEYPPHYGNTLTPYLQRKNPSGLVTQFARELMKEADHSPSAFPGLLAARINKICDIEFREQGDPMLPEQVLAGQPAACRDLAVLFMDACRSIGLASRFTSGYYHLESEAPERELHAWAEVYFPGAGWRGYDPTHGLTVSNCHVAVASGADPVLAAPTYGSLRGTGAKTTLKYEISIQVSETAPLT
ncbi:MAG: transglutaminase [Nitrospinaceae bacterium]|nr:MAG: transglutaminase [Nitrospinaceae bacterium]